MSRKSIQELKPGMITANDIFSNNKMIVPKDVVLTDNIISRLSNYSIYYIDVLETSDDELFNTVPNSELTQEGNISNKERIKNSPEFLRFYEDFNACASHYQDTLMEALYHNKPFKAQELLNETINLMYPDGYSIDVFDMLLNMRNLDDSVYIHCIDVALISTMLAKWLHFSETDQVMATACGLFHDVGKFVLPQSILRKPGKLTPEEFDIIKTHTTEGYHILKNFKNIPKSVIDSALMHHEKCDGSGYPYGLKGDEIDKFSKIVTIADIFDAMTSDRVYRKALCPFTVIKFFEDDGLQKYELKYILTFLENVANSYLNHRVMLSNGMEGNVVFINRSSLSRPTIATETNEIINLQDEYYKNIMNLTNNKNISIETII